MTNGFYDTSKIKSKAAIKKLIIDAMLLSYNVRVETKYNEDNSFYGRREITRNYTVQSIIDIANELYVVDRNAYNKGELKSEEDDGEIMIASSKWEFVYCYITLANLQKIVDKYKLKLKEW
jgi:hypothetical protein